MKIPQHKSPSTLHGVVLVASGAIGAGMFSLPIVSAGMWFGWSVAGLCLVWLVNLTATLLLLESNLLYHRGASFDTVVGGSLGGLWKSINNLAIVFVMYILLYAYFSASGSIAGQTLSSTGVTELPVSQNLLGVVFGMVIALLVWSGASAVSRICSVLLIAMLITFLLSTSGLLLHLQLGNLLTQSNSSLSLLPYSFAALPYFVTAFACSGLVPSLVKYYGHEPARIRHCLLYG
ncbi:MAG: tryptophan permease, partial [Gammaproteobacteria bacterium]|nr:tryptophan permease [Gammaproteobacteria bacterium]